MRKSILSFLEKKGKNEKITMVSAYDYHSAKILDNCDIDNIGWRFISYDSAWHARYFKCDHG